MSEIPDEVPNFTSEEVECIKSNIAGDNVQTELSIDVERSDLITQLEVEPDTLRPEMDDNLNEDLPSEPAVVAAATLDCSSSTEPQPSSTSTAAVAEPQPSSTSTATAVPVMQPSSSADADVNAISCAVVESSSTRVESSPQQRAAVVEHQQRAASLSVIEHQHREQQRAAVVEHQPVRASTMHVSSAAADSSNERHSSMENIVADSTDSHLKQTESGALILNNDHVNLVDDSVSPLEDIQTRSDIRFFICGSCKNNPIQSGSTPKLLPCLHSFCEPCLQERYENQKTSSEASGVVSSPRLKCPSCGQEFLVSGGEEHPTSGFLNNQFIIESAASIIGALSAAGGSGAATVEVPEHACTSCDDEATAHSYCLNCAEWLCDACTEAHRRVKVTKDHVIQAKSGGATDSSALGATPGEKPLFCKVHPQEQLKLFCGPCDKLTCRDCQLTEHKEHRYQFIEEAASKHREILSKLLQYLQINLGLLKETIVDVEKVSDGLSTQQIDIETELDKAFNTLKEAITARQESLRRELVYLVQSKQALLAKQKKDLTQMRVILEHNHDFAEFAVKGGSNVALLYSRKVLGTRLHNLNSLKYRQKPLASRDFKFSMDVDKLCTYFSKTGAVFSQEDMQRKIDYYNNPTGTSAAGSTSRTSTTTGGNASRAQHSMHHAPGGSNNNIKQVAGQVNRVDLTGAGNPSLMRAPLATAAGAITSDTPFINLSSSQAINFAARGQHTAARSYDTTGSSSSVGNRRPVTTIVGAGRPATNMLPAAAVAPTQSVLPDSTGMNKAELTAKYIQHLQKERGHQQPQRIAPTAVGNMKPPLSTAPSGNTGMAVSSSHSGKTFHHRGASPASAGSEQFRRLLSPHQLPMASAHSGGGGGGGGGRDWQSGQQSSASTISELQRLVDGTTANSAFTRQQPTRPTPVGGAGAGNRASPSSGNRASPSSGRHDASAHDNTGGGVKQEDGNEGGNGTNTLYSALIRKYSTNGGQDDAGSRESGFDENQSNEDYCGVCRNGGQLLCCDTCPKVYHLQCHIPALTILPSDSWSCGLCETLTTHYKSGQKRRNSFDALSDSDIKICDKLLLHLFTHQDSMPFHHKVSKSQVPDYYKVIAKPMDLTLIHSRVRPQSFEQYKSLEEFVLDVRMIFNNCFIYNSATSDVYKMGKNLEAYFDSLLAKHAPFVNATPPPHDTNTVSDAVAASDAAMAKRNRVEQEVVQSTVEVIDATPPPLTG